MLLLFGTIECQGYLFPLTLGSLLFLRFVICCIVGLWLQLCAFLSQSDNLRESLQLALRVKLCHFFDPDPPATIVKPPNSAQGLQHGTLVAECTGRDKCNSVLRRSNVNATQMLLIGNDHEREECAAALVERNGEGWRCGVIIS